MGSFSFFNQVSIILITVLIALYYYAFWRYNRYLKNKKNIKNINQNTTEVKNINIFTENIESVPLYNKKEIFPSVVSKNNDWKKILDDIQDQALELNTNNSLDHLLNEMDIDTKDQ